MTFCRTCSRSILWVALLAATAPLAVLTAQPPERPSEISNHALQQLAYRDRQVEAVLRWLQAQTYDDVDLPLIERVQAVLNRPSDSFAVTQDGESGGESLRSARTAVITWLDDAPPTFIDQYRRVYDAEAQRLLGEAIAARDPLRFQDITRRYFHTRPGLKAADWLSTYWLDRGFPELACSLWTRVLNSPHHQDEIRGSMLLKAGIAARQQQDDELERLVLEKLTEFDTEISVGGRRQDLTSAVELADHDERERSSQVQNAVIGTGLGAFRTAASVPLPSPVWSAPRFMKNASASEALIETWQREQRARYQPDAAALLPVIANQQVIFRDGQGIRGLDLATGQPLWHYESEQSISDRLFGAATSVVANAAAAAVPAQQIQRHLAGSGLEGILSTDGRRVYFVDTARSLSNPARKAGNYLAAIGLPPGKGREAGQVSLCWQFPPEVDGEIFVLGVPLPLAGQLFVMVERRGQIEVVSLDPEAGRVNWTQPIAVAEIPIDMDHDRQLLQTTPVYAGGLLICPTQVGILVGVDPLDGRLAWAYHYGDELELYQSRGRHYSSRSSTGHPGFPSLPLVDGDAVYYLPRHSAWIHCLDRSTGTLRWRVPRGDAEYLGPVIGERLVVVGRSRIRGLSISTGEQQWTHACEMPSGIGIQLDSVYLVPQTDTEPLQIDVASGQRVGLPIRVRDDVRLGHLMAHDGLVVSSTLESVSVYPEAARELSRVTQELAGTSTPETHLRAAEICLSLGEISAADEHLVQVLGAEPKDEVRHRARRLLRDLLYYRLGQPDVSRDAIFARLDDLAETPIERARLGMHVLEARVEDRDFDAVLRAVDELTRLNVRRSLALPNDASAAAAPAVWVRRQLRRLDETGNADWRTERQDYLAVRQSQVLADQNLAEMETFLTTFGDYPEAIEVGLELGQLARRRGDNHYAEMVLSWVSIQPGEDLPLLARERQRQMWAEAGFRRALQPKSAHVAAASPPVSRVQIRESFDIPTTIPVDPWAKGFDRASDAFAAFGGIYNRYRRRLSTPENFGHDMLVKPTDDGSVLVAIDQGSGALRAEFSLPNQYEYPKNERQGYHQHYFALAAAGEILGYSVLEPRGGEPLWRQSPEEISGRQDVPQIGPAGATFAVFQTRDHLFVINPATGDVLWRQSDLPSPCGLFLESTSGLFGDDQALVVLGPDRQSYQVFETMTGWRIRAGELASEDRHAREVHGRMMLLAIRDEESDRYSPSAPLQVLWDPLTDENLFAERVTRGKPMSSTISDKELAIIGDDSIKVINPTSGEVQSEIAISGRELDDLSYFRAFADREYYYLNLQRTKRRVSGSGSSYISNPFVPVTLIRDDLYCVDRQTGKVLWKRGMPQRTVLSPPAHADLPVLILLSQSGRAYRYDRNQKGLSIEVLDRRTGERLAERNDLTLDRILQADYDPARNVVELFGQKTVYEIELSAGGEPVPSK